MMKYRVKKDVTLSRNGKSINLKENQEVSEDDILNVIGKFRFKCTSDKHLFELLNDEIETIEPTEEVIETIEPTEEVTETIEPTMELKFLAKDLIKKGRKHIFKEGDKITLSEFKAEFELKELKEFLDQGLLIEIK